MSWHTVLPGVVLLVFLAVSAFPQASQKPPLPDAPSSQQPPQKFPTGTPPAPKTSPPAAESPAQSGPGTPDPTVATVPQGQAPQVAGGHDQIYKFVTNVNFVVVPVTVKDPAGHLVEGLGPKDFTIYENEESQEIRFFSSDPFPLSAAVVIDVGLADVDLQRVLKGVSALAGAFSQFDELAVYIYGNTLKKVHDYTAVNDHLLETLRNLKDKQHGAAGGPPVVGGPLGQSTPTVNGRSVDPSRPSVEFPSTQEESHILNDAVLAAATDLAKRDRARRRVIFVISDGREKGSDAKYSEVLKVLLSEQIQVYGLGVGGAAIPGYGRLQQIPFPGRGTGDILTKYASATGGQEFKEFSQRSIEAAYARITSEARNQYTIGYTTRSTLANNYRSITVTVHQPGLKVYAKDGYYPLPPAK